MKRMRGKMKAFFKKKKIWKNMIMSGVMVCAAFLFWPSRFTPLERVYADEPCIIVIDPGHGGENLGANPRGIEEKDLNMVVALAMYEELIQYDNVEVYLTHTEDVDMSLRERARFAADKNADFLFCLHFNMSPRHNLFGTEVWISAFDEYYAKGLSFGKIQIETMEGLGLYSRGVKTKLMESRIDDYYGIIRESRSVGVTCALIEHCHLDHENDKGYYETVEKLQALGRADAEAAAKYLGLSSSKLGIDYSDYPREEVQVPTTVMAQDYTAPEFCQIEELSCDPSTGEVTFALTARDPDSPMLYYSYSINGGMSWSNLFAWQKGAETMNITLTVPSGREMPKISFRAHNLYDRFTESNAIVYPTFHYGEEEKTEAVTSDAVALDNSQASADSSVSDRTDYGKNLSNSGKGDVPFLAFLVICLIIACTIFFAALVARLVKAVKRRRRRR